MLRKLISVFRYKYTIPQIINYFKFLIKKRNKVVLSYKPLWMLIYVTDLCNLHCAMCPHHTMADSSQFSQAKKLNNDFISLETLEYAFRLFPESYYVMLAGVGEPLLHPEFRDVIQLCEKHHKKIKIVTNGTKLDKEMAAFLVSSKCVDEIQISLNAPDKETYYDICRGSEEEFRRVVNNIKGIVGEKKNRRSALKIVVSAVCGEEFKSKACAFLSFADNLGVDQIELFRYIDFNISGNHFSDLKDDKAFLDALNIWAAKNIRASFSLPHCIRPDNFMPRCNWFWKNISIDSAGNIGSCGRVISPNHVYGNVFEDKDVWNGKYMQSMRRLFLEGDNHYPSDCCRLCVENYRN